MLSKCSSLAAAGALVFCASAASAQTAPYFTPLTESAPVVEANAEEEVFAPWVVPAGISQVNLTSMQEIEGDPEQSVSRAEGAGNVASMWDMTAYDATGRFVFIPHESPYSGGLSRYDRWTDETQLLWNGDGEGVNGDWSNDFGAFDPATFTPNCTVWVAEEWTGEGRVIETLNPYAPVDQIKTREVQSIANVSHEGLRFSDDGRTVYYVDEWRSGSIYKFVARKKGDYTKGQTFVLVVNAFDGNPADNYNDESNVDQVRTGRAKWVPITTRRGKPLTEADPFRNGPTNDPRENDDTRGGRIAADEVNGTPFGRPEDMEIGRLANGKEVVFFAATSENTIYAIEIRGKRRAFVRAMASGDTPTNVGFAPTTGVLNSPDNLAQDALGNIYIIEDAPNGSDTGGDIWFVRDEDDDGVAESLDHFLSIRVAGSEATGMIFNPLNPTQFVVAVQHPASTDLDNVPDGFGDALWQFDVTGAENRGLVWQLKWAGLQQRWQNRKQTAKCRLAAFQQRWGAFHESFGFGEDL